MDGEAPERLEANASGIARAAGLLRAGRLVAVPTETVYGLAARADSEAAVAEIFRAKGRPDFNPLIVHVASLAMARELAVLDERAEPDRLARRVVPRELAGGLDAEILERPGRPEVARELGLGDRARAEQLPRAIVA